MREHAHVNKLKTFLRGCLIKNAISLTRLLLLCHLLPTATFLELRREKASTRRNRLVVFGEIHILVANGSDFGDWLISKRQCLPNLEACCGSHSDYMCAALFFSLSWWRQMTPTRCEISIFISPLALSLTETEILWLTGSWAKSLGPKHTDSLFKGQKKSWQLLELNNYFGRGTAPRVNKKISAAFARLNELHFFFAAEGVHWI